MATTLPQFKDNFWGSGSKGFEALVARVNQDVEATKEIQEFSRSWRQTEEDYANDIIRNVAMNPVKTETGSTGNALVTLAQLLDTCVRTNLEVATIFKDDLELPLDGFKKKLRKLKKQIESDYDKVYKQFQKEVITTERLQKEYAAKSKEVCEKANKVSGGILSKKLMISEAELEKIAGEYRAAIEKCDRMQDVYEAKYQEICSTVEAHERERLQIVKSGLEKVVGSQVGKLLQFKEKIYASMVDVVSNINIDEDIQHIITCAGLGTQRPERHRFSDAFRGSESLDAVRNSAGDITKTGSGDIPPTLEAFDQIKEDARIEIHEPHQDAAPKYFSLRLTRNAHNNRVDVAQRKAVQSSIDVSTGSGRKKYGGEEQSPRFDLNELKTATLERGKRGLTNAFLKVVPGRSPSNSAPSLLKSSQSADSLTANLSAGSALPFAGNDNVDEDSSLTTLSHLRTNTAPAASTRPVSCADSIRTLSLTSTKGAHVSEQSIDEEKCASTASLSHSSSNALSQNPSPSHSVNLSTRGDYLVGASAGSISLSSAAISPSVSITSIAQIHRASLVGEERVIIRHSISEEPGAFDDVLKSAQKKEETNRVRSVQEGTRYSGDAVPQDGAVDGSGTARDFSNFSKQAFTKNILEEGEAETASGRSVPVNHDVESGAERPSPEKNDTIAEADSGEESDLPVLPDMSTTGREKALKRGRGSPTDPMESSRHRPTVDASAFTAAPIPVPPSQREVHDHKEGELSGESSSQTSHDSVHNDAEASHLSFLSKLEADIARSLGHPSSNFNSSQANAQPSAVSNTLNRQAPVPMARTKSNNSMLAQNIPTSIGRAGTEDQRDSPVIPPRTFSPKPIPAPRPDIPKHKLSKYTQNSLPFIDAPVAVSPATENSPVAKNPRYDALASDSSKKGRSSPDLFPSMDRISDGTLKRKSKMFTPRKSKIQGWVYVCEDNVKTWEHRWTCLEGGYLWFFEQPDDFLKCNKPRGMVAVCTPQASSTVVDTKISVPWAVPDTENRPFSVSLIVNVNKSLVLSWENEVERNKWVDVLVAEISAARKLAADL